MPLNKEFFTQQVNQLLESYKDQDPEQLILNKRLCQAELTNLKRRVAEGKVVVGLQPDEMGWLIDLHKKELMLIEAQLRAKAVELSRSYGYH